MKIGDKVVCVRSGSSITKYKDNVFPIKGEIYTVRNIYTCGGSTGLLLEEIKNQVHTYNDGLREKSFNIKTFRPIDYTTGEKIAEVLEGQFNKQPVITL